MIFYWLLYLLFIAINIFILYWGLQEKDRYYQYPPLASAAWLGYFGPQVYRSITNIDKYPDSSIEDGGMLIALIMCIICSAMGWYGYQHNHLKRDYLIPDYDIDIDKAFQFACLLYCFAFFSAFKLAALSGGFLSQFTEGGHYELEWTGAPVMYSFFVGFMMPALGISLLCVLLKPNVIKTVVVFFQLIYPVSLVLFMGRRSKLIELVLISLLVYYFSRRKAPPKPLIFASAAICLLFVILAPTFRSYANRGEFWRFREIDYKWELTNELTSEDDCEFDGAVVTSAARLKEFTFQWGAGIYNATISSLIPRQVVGQKFKDSMIIQIGESDTELTLKKYQWERAYGWFETGPASAFSNFCFLGAFVYFLLARAFRYIWDRAMNSVFWQVTYIIFALEILSTIVNSINYILTSLIINGFVLFVLYMLSMKRKQEYDFISPNECLCDLQN